jgi:hypothetical protein
MVMNDAESRQLLMDMVDALDVMSNSLVVVGTRQVWFWQTGCI